MATTIKNTDMVFENDKKMTNFLDKVFADPKTPSNNEYVKQTVRRVNGIRNITVNGKKITI